MLAAGEADGERDNGEVDEHLGPGEARGDCLFAAERGEVPQAAGEGEEIDEPLQPGEVVGAAHERRARGHDEQDAHTRRTRKPQPLPRPVVGRAQAFRGAAEEGGFLSGRFWLQFFT